MMNLPPTPRWWSVVFHTVALPHGEGTSTEIVVEAERPKDALLIAVGRFLPRDDELIGGAEMSQPFASKTEAEEWQPPA